MCVLPRLQLSLHLPAALSSQQAFTEVAAALPAGIMPAAGPRQIRFAQALWRLHSCLPDAILPAASS